VYWGNRHWHPFLADTLRQMAGEGIRRALAFVTSAFGSFPGCRQYLRAIESARAEVGPSAPEVEKLRTFFNHPGFIEPMAERVADALAQIPAERRAAARLVYTAHSIPAAMARGSPYQTQLREACALASEQAACEGRSSQEGLAPQGTGPFTHIPAWDLVYQSRSGPPSQPWLGPELGDHLRQLAAGGQTRDVVLAPIGFLSAHVEVVYDLDIEARRLCDELGLRMVRSAVVGCHPRFVRMIRELIVERFDAGAPRLALGRLGPSPDRCAPDCCPPC
jgi:protoporphyrin/coproporphyrin ferrochelatase